MYVSMGPVVWGSVDGADIGERLPLLRSRHRAQAHGAETDRDVGHLEPG